MTTITELNEQIKMYESQINDLEIQLRTVKGVAGKILQEVYDDCEKTLAILKNKSNDYICDNTDCSGKNENKSKRVILTDEFDSDICCWCDDCIKRDKNMIEEIFKRDE